MGSGRVRSGRVRSGEWEGEEWEWGWGVGGRGVGSGRVRSGSGEWEGEEWGEENRAVNSGRLTSLSKACIDSVLILRLSLAPAISASKPANTLEQLVPLCKVTWESCDTCVQ